MIGIDLWCWIWINGCYSYSTTVSGCGRDLVVRLRRLLLTEICPQTGHDIQHSPSTYFLNAEYEMREQLVPLLKSLVWFDLGSNRHFLHAKSKADALVTELLRQFGNRYRSALIFVSIMAKFNQVEVENKECNVSHNFSDIVRLSEDILR